MFVASLLLLAAAWEAYKLVGPDDGVLFGRQILPRANDVGMPHVWSSVERFFDAENARSDRPVWRVVLAATWYSFRLAFVGFGLGAMIGIGLAVVMARFRVVERGLLPYIIISQTVPMIALAPLIVSWGGRLQLAGWEWPRWMSVAVLGAFLAFFPVAIGTLRGLESASTTSLELMRSYASSWRQTLFKLRFPAAVPHMVPALKLAATAAVIGVVVAEISTALRGGVGRLIFDFSRQATGDPAKVYSALLGAAALGLGMTGVVVLFERLAMRNRPAEQIDEAIP